MGRATYEFGPVRPSGHNEICDEGNDRCEGSFKNEDPLRRKIIEIIGENMNTPLPTPFPTHTIHQSDGICQYPCRNIIVIRMSRRKTHLIPPNAPAKAAPPKKIATRQLRSRLWNSQVHIVMYQCVHPPQIIY